MSERTDPERQHGPLAFMGVLFALGAGLMLIGIGFMAGAAMRGCP